MSFQNEGMHVLKEETTAGKRNNINQQKKFSLRTFDLYEKKRTIPETCGLVWNVRQRFPEKRGMGCRMRRGLFRIKFMSHRIR